MKHRIVYLPAVLKEDLAPLSNSDRIKVADGVVRLSKQHPADLATRLCREAGNPWRMNAGYVSVIFDWDPKKREICVLGIFPTSSVLETIAPRLKGLSVAGF